MSFTRLNTARSYPNHPYKKIKDAILGESYELTLVFVGKERALSLNQKYRKATYIPNVLSFPLTKSVGEIYITPALAKKEAEKFDMTQNGYIAYLYIHGLLHLKGMSHGATMEKAEKRFLKQFKIA